MFKRSLSLTLSYFKDFKPSVIWSYFLRPKIILQAKFWTDWSLLLDCQIQSESGFHFVFYFILFYFFSVSGKVLPVTPLVSSVFVHRLFSAYFVRFEGAGVIRRFPWCTQEKV